MTDPEGGAALDDLLAAWLPTRRWFPAKGSDAHVEPVAVVPLGAPGVEAHVLRLVGPAGDVLLHVPLVLVPASADAAAAPGHAAPDEVSGVVGTVARDGASYVVHDGPAHPAYLAAVLGAADWADDVPPRSPGDLDDARVVTGEQSNTSVVLPRLAGGAILKVLRTVAPGPNPDLVVPRALAADGWTGVPRPLAWSAVRAADAGLDTGPNTGPNTGLDTAAGSPAGADGTDGEVVLAICSALVPGADDGFERACRAARTGQRFTADAAALGTLVAELHARLRRAFDAGDAPHATIDPGWLVADLRERAGRAVASTAPRLDDRAPAIARLHAALAADLAAPGPDVSRPDVSRPDASGTGTLPRLQRIHGDLHLGQVLHGDDGWHVLDFEGEPMRPVAERTRPDLALRDVAGMLRSFDYAAAVGHAADAAWAEDARDAFLTAYRAADDTGWTALDDRLLAALELDKALYEVVYEVRNRPAWVEIPLRGVDRVLAGR